MVENNLRFITLVQDIAVKAHFIWVRVFGVLEFTYLPGSSTLELSKFPIRGIL